MSTITVKVPPSKATAHITEAEEKLIRYFQQTLGAGFTALYSCIFKMDTHNRNKLAQGFPEEVEVCNRWNNERGYSTDLVRRYNLEYHTQIEL